MVPAAGAMLQTADKHSTNLKEAAFINALARLTEATKT
jgi:hypothetical protein